MFQDIIYLYMERWPFFQELILQHIQIALTSILISGTIGLFLGILISEYKTFSSWIIGGINIAYTIPSISMLGFLIPLTGIGQKTAMIALTIYGLLPMVRNTYTGIISIEPAVIEVAKGMGSTPWQVLYKVKLPLAIPVIISGIRSMVVMTISLSGIASYIGAGGLGVAIYRGITTNNAAMTYAGSILIAIIALSSDQFIAYTERCIRKKWHLSA